MTERSYPPPALIGSCFPYYKLNRIQRVEKTSAHCRPSCSSLLVMDCLRGTSKRGQFHLLSTYLPPSALIRSEFFLLSTTFWEVLQCVLVTTDKLHVSSQAARRGGVLVWSLFVLFFTATRPVLQSPTFFCSGRRREEGCWEGLDQGSGSTVCFCVYSTLDYLKGGWRKQSGLGDENNVVFLNC